jgi:hypothetical protein
VDDAGSGAAGEGARAPHADLPNSTKPVAELKSALRHARVENAERSQVVADLHAAEVARLELLQDDLQPILAQVPADCDLFDVALAPSEHPRLFIDMLGFVEMGRDRRVYRFVQDTRHGRLTICETEQLDKVVAAVTNYIAQRLIERERALASDAGSAAPRLDVAPVVPAVASVARPTSKRSRSARLFVASVDLIGIVALLALVAAAVLYALQVQIP